MKILFNKIQKYHLDTIMKWRMLPEVSDYMYTDPVLDIELQLSWFEKISIDNNRYDWVCNVDGEDVGVVTVSNIDYVNNKCDWAYYLASPTVRGKGIGKAIELNILDFVFNDLKLNKLCCEVFSSNELVVKIHEKYGSKVEGVRKSHICKKGEYKDIVVMGILKKDYEEQIKGKIDYTTIEMEK